MLFSPFTLIIVLFCPCQTLLCLPQDARTLWNVQPDSRSFLNVCFRGEYLIENFTIGLDLKSATFLQEFLAAVICMMYCSSFFRDFHLFTIHLVFFFFWKLDFYLCTSWETRFFKSLSFIWETQFLSLSFVWETRFLSLSCVWKRQYLSLSCVCQPRYLIVVFCMGNKFFSSLSSVWELRYLIYAFLYGAHEFYLFLVHEKHNTIFIFVFFYGKHDI